MWDAEGDPCGQYPETPKRPTLEWLDNRLFTAWVEIRSSGGVSTRGVLDWCELRGVRDLDTKGWIYDVLCGAELTLSRTEAKLAEEAGSADAGA